MGNCTASKLGGGEEEAVSLCRDRKRLLKAAVERRQALADAYELYIHSLHAVAGAINLFVARHSAPSPVLITLPSSSSSDPSFLRQTPTEPKTEALTYRSSISSSTSSAPTSALMEEAEGEERRGLGGEMGYGYLFSDMPAAVPSPAEAVFGWDFFNPFEGARAAEGELCRCAEDLRMVREREGIPELEEEGHECQEAKRELTPMAAAVNRETDMKVVEAVMSQECEGGERKESGLTVMEAPEKKIELLDALKDVEEEFIKAYDFGKELARMLEANKVHVQPGNVETNENSSKFIQAITWHRSLSSLSSSSRSYLVSSSNESLPTVSKSELFDDYGGMGSGSHSQTLGRLYAWYKKLYEEVKAGEQTRQMYQKKCLQLRNHDTTGSGSRTVDKTRAAVKDLYARIWVALRTIETISVRIEKVRDQELQPQLIELLQGMLDSWSTMLKSHDRQMQIMLGVKAFTCPSYGRYCSDSQRQVTKKLEEQIDNWRACFKNYVAAQRAYAEALDCWLSKFFVPDIKYYSRIRSLAPSHREGASPFLLILHEWLNSSRKLPDRAVSLSMKGFINNMRVLLVKQGDEQQQKRKVDGLAKEFDQRISALQKAENRILESKLSDMKPESEVHAQMEHLEGRKDLVNLFRQRLELEKAKHQNCMQETTQTTLNGFKAGLANVFESLAEFSRDSQNMYNELLSRYERAKAADEAAAKKPSCIEASKVEADNR